MLYYDVFSTCYTMMFLWLFSTYYWDNSANHWATVLLSFTMTFFNILYFDIFSKFSTCYTMTFFRHTILWLFCDFFRPTIEEIVLTIGPLCCFPLLWLFSTYYTMTFFLNFSTCYTMTFFRHAILRLFCDFFRHTIEEVVLTNGHCTAFLYYDFIRHTILWLFFLIFDMLYYDVFVTFFDILLRK